MRLSEYLLLHDIKPSAFAEELGVPPSTVMRWARGDRTPRQAQMQKIVSATGGAVCPNDFLPSAKIEIIGSSSEAVP